MNKLKNKNFIYLILLIMLLATSCSVPKMYPDKKFIIKNEIKINYDTLDTFQTINKSDFNSFVRLKPNRKFLRQPIQARTTTAQNNARPCAVRRQTL